MTTRESIEAVGKTLCERGNTSDAAGVVELYAARWSRRNSAVLAGHAGRWRRRHLSDDPRSRGSGRFGSRSRSHLCYSSRGRRCSGHFDWQVHGCLEARRKRKLVLAPRHLELRCLAARADTPSSTVQRDYRPHWIACPVSSAGGGAKTMPASSSAANAPRGRDKRPCGRPSEAPGRRCAPLCDAPASRRRARLARNLGGPSNGVDNPAGQY